MDFEEYGRTLKKSPEFLAAEIGLGPYIGFGLSDVHGTLTIAMGLYFFDSNL